MQEIKNIGYIYKITNLVNGKIYIGQTKQTLNERWREHKVHSKTLNYSLYKVMRKYGIDNFKFEEIEKCEIEKLNEREIFWISFYDSFNKKKGYNLTRGGKGNKLLNLDEDEIIKSYKEFGTLSKVANKFSCDRTSIQQVLKKHNIKIKTEEEHAKEKGNKVYRCDLDGNIIEEYICLNEAGKWLIDNNLTNARDARNAAMAIKNNIIKDKSYKGFVWKCTLYENIDSIVYFKYKYKPKSSKPKLPKPPKIHKPRIKKEYFCSCCGAKIQKTSTLCVDCYRKEQSKNIPPREILKQEIRTMSFLQIGKKYGVSDNSIRKWCKKYNLPFKSSEIKSYSDEEWENI